MSIFTKSGEINGDSPDHSQRESTQSRSQANSDTSGEVSIVGRGVRIVGDIHVIGDVRVGGRIEGAVHVQERIVVASEGLILGGIEAGEGDIAGIVEGDIVTRGRLIIRKSASVLGSITSTQLMVEEGAAIEGICRVGKPSRVNAEKDAPGGRAAEAKPALLPFDKGTDLKERRADAI